jgi:hypothetical protein
MDRHHSLTTSAPALRSDNKPDAFCAHPDLPPVTVKMLHLQYRVYLCPDDSRWATKLARLSASEAARTLARLSASDVVAGRFAAEFNKRDRENKYLRPTVWADLWRDPHTRRKLQRILRELDHPEHQRFLAGLHMALHDEPRMRAIQFAQLLIDQAELAAQPLRPEVVDRLIENERQRAENLRRAEMDSLAWIRERRAAQLAREHERDFRTEAEREDAMIRAAAKWLIWHFAMRGDRLVACLVGEALGRVINFRRVRYVVTGR